MTKNEFSRPVDPESVGEAETVHDIAATASEREALAARFDFRSVEKLAATVRLRRDAERPAIRVQGRVLADVVQDCVVTLVPVSTHIDEAFTALFDADFIDAGDGVAAAGESGGTVVVDVEDDDVEPLTGAPIDIGELVAERLALALPAHPRAEGALFEMPDGAKPEPLLPLGRARPFAGLDKRMKSQ